MIYVGIDNGVSGTIGIITPLGAWMYKTPTRKVRDYTKKKKYINRVDVDKLYDVIDRHISRVPREEIVVSIERPMLNSARFNASISAARSLEATLITLEMLMLEWSYIDSKEWQHALLPEGIKGSVYQKKASKNIGILTYPHLQEQIEKHGDADGLLIAEYLKRSDSHIEHLSQL